MYLCARKQDFSVMNNDIMKQIPLIFLLLFTGSVLQAQPALRRINRDSFYSEFLQSICIFDYEDTGSNAVYSWLTSKDPKIHWKSFFGNSKYLRKYQASAADGFPLYNADDLLFAMVAYTKGDFALLICNVISYADIDEHRLYTYDYYGNVIDSLYLQHLFCADNGHVLMPLAGALMGNLDVRTCEIIWKGDILPYHPTSRNIVGGKHEGQRVDSYYTIDETGHFILKSQVKYKPKLYSEEEITSLDLTTKEGHKRKVIFKPMPVADVQEVIEY